MCASIYCCLFFIIRTLSRANLGGVPIVNFLLVLVVTILGMSVLLILANILLRNRYHDSGSSFTSLFQGATRFHGFVALAIIGPLYGNDGITLAALALDAPATPLTGIIVVGNAGTLTKHCSTIVMISDSIIVCRVVINTLVISGFYMVTMNA